MTPKSGDSNTDSKGWLEKHLHQIIALLLAVSFAVFVVCSALTIISSNQTNGIIESIAAGEDITENDIRAFEALRSYYTDSSNSTISALIYGIISLIITGVLGVIVQGQKGELDKIEKSREELRDRVEQALSEVTERSVLLLNGLNALNKFSMEATALERRVNDLDIRFRSTLISSAFETVHAFATAVSFQCNNPDISMDDISPYLVRIRDCIDPSNDSAIIIKALKEMGPPANEEKDASRSMLWMICNLLKKAHENAPDVFDADLYKEFEGHIRHCINLLG